KRTCGRSSSSVRIRSARVAQANTRSSTQLVGGGTVQLGAGGRRNGMIAEPKQQPHNQDSNKRERRRDEIALDEALRNDFPASEPVSVEQPVLPRSARAAQEAESLL